MLIYNSNVDFDFDKWIKEQKVQDRKKKLERIYGQV